MYTFFVVYYLISKQREREGGRERERKRERERETDLGFSVEH